MELTSPYLQNVRHWLTLSQAPGVTAHRFHKLLAQINSPSQIMEGGSSLWRHLGLSEPTCNYLGAPNERAIDQQLTWLTANLNHHIILFTDERYPGQLGEIADPPALLYIIGDPETLLTPQIAMVGSRNPSHSGRETAFAFAQALSQAGLTITSGMALGIDAASHQGALTGNGRTVAVLGTGVDIIYPTGHRHLAAEIAQKGALVSEFPLQTPPINYHFPQRNRIVSGLSLGTLVVEATARSGSLITARLATEQGREVFAIPGSIHSPMAHGCHLLLRQGAKLVETSTDILEEITQFQPLLTGKPPKSAYNNSKNPLDESSRKLLECVGFEATSIDTLVARTGFAVEQVASALMILELAGHINSTPSGYSRVTHERRFI